jgi:hypothetical protein
VDQRITSVVAFMQLFRREVLPQVRYAWVHHAAPFARASALGPTVTSAAPCPTGHA